MYKMTSYPANRRSRRYPIQPWMFLVIFTTILNPILFTDEANPNPAPSQSSKLTRATPSPALSISSSCRGNIPYKSACESVLLSLKNYDLSVPINPEVLFDDSVEFALSQTRSALALASHLTLSHHKSQFPLAGGMIDCIELHDDTLDQLSNVINRRNNPTHTHHDVQTWLSSSLTNQETCVESLENDRVEKGTMDSMAKNLSQYISNSLALYVSHYNPDETNDLNLNPNARGGRKLLSDGFPEWVTGADRKLLGASVGDIEAHAVVKQDGSGTHRTIGEAIEFVASLDGGGRSVIHIAAGTYHENINIPTKQKNVMLVGDGKGTTVIVGSRSNEGGWSTYRSATVAAMGDGFIARDITIVNNAGPTKQQAVALRVGSDQSVIFHCSVQGYQDTIYTHSKRQFYRETDIYGTVDFIFGNSAVVFQNCNIFARKPSSGVNNYVTAQGRISPNQNTGISIHNCKIVAASDLGASKSRTTYLGRPWKEYSRTVIMQSFLDDIINPSGWSPWHGGFALKTLYYGEYGNSGPGASTSGRVNWPGYQGTLTPAQAQTFTVGRLISGNLWLPSTGVTFDSGLVG